MITMGRTANLLFLESAPAHQFAPRLYGGCGLYQPSGRRQVDFWQQPGKPGASNKRRWHPGSKSDKSNKQS
jgi:hypothetical protein